MQQERSEQEGDERRVEMFIRGGDRRFTLEYHYLGDPETRKSEFVCMTILDAINLTLESENWRPIVFDTFTEEEE